MDKSIEAAARAICREQALGEPPLEYIDSNWPAYTELARAAIAAYRDAEIERLTAEITETASHYENVLEKHEKTIADLRAKLEAAERDASNHQKMLEYVARIAYRKGSAGVVNFDTGEHDIDSTISGARKWLAEDEARGGERG